MSDWLDKLKVGDEVVVTGREHPYVTKVARLTATLVITTKGGKFRRSSGDSSGGNMWDRCSLYEPTQERRDEVGRQNLASHLRQVQWKDYPLDKLRAIFQLLNE